MLAWLFILIVLGMPGFALTAVVTGEWRWLIGTVLCYLATIAGVRRR